LKSASFDRQITFVLVNNTVSYLFIYWKTNQWYREFSKLGVYLGI